MTQKQRQRERPPTASEARQWYSDGWIGEEGLEELLDNAIVYYGGDGDQEFAEVDGIETTKAKAEEIQLLRDRANQTRFGLGDVEMKPIIDELLKAAIWLFLGVLLYDLFLAANQPPAGAVPI